MDIRQIDEAIIEHIERTNGESPQQMHSLAYRITKYTDSDGFRVIDRRTQSLRRRDKISCVGRKWRVNK